MTDLHNVIDFASSTPYYSQLKEILLQEINLGKYQPGESLPTHAELCEKYNISKAVVRQTFKELEIDGKIIQRRGKPATFAEQKISGDLLQRLSGTYHNMARLGYYPTTKVLQNHVIPATETIAERLQILRGDLVIELKRLRFINNEPFVFMLSYVPFDLCPKIAEIDLTGKSLLEETKKEYNFIITSSRRSIEAVSAQKYESELLNITKGAPLLLFNSVSFIVTGRAIGTTRAYFRGDRARFDVEIGDIRGE
jgi:GntR family transcriptional regulator